MGAQEAADSGAPCDISVQESNLTLNCSRRDIDRVPNWPDQINDFQKGNADYRTGLFIMRRYQARCDVNKTNNRSPINIFLSSSNNLQ